jgi:hypothetical protein
MIPECSEEPARISTHSQRGGAGFKLLKPPSSFRHLRILFFCRFYEVYSPRHALKVSLPTSKPCRPLVDILPNGTRHYQINSIIFPAFEHLVDRLIKSIAKTSLDSRADKNIQCSLTSVLTEIREYV